MRRGLLPMMTAIALTQGLAAAGIGTPPRRREPPHEKSPADLERIAAAQAKRERRAAKRGQR